MPIYEYACQHKKCNVRKDVLHSVAELKEPSEETIKEITCPKKGHGLMQREFTVPHVANSQGGVTVPESVLLAKKQEKLKTRSRAHFKNDVLPTLKGSDRKYFENKYKGTKTVDHEKIK